MSRIDVSRREFIIRMSSVSAAVAAGGVLSACGGGNGNEIGNGKAGVQTLAIDSDTMVRFDHGVASGDPLADRVMLWTHARFSGRSDDVPLRWELARDAAFAEVVSTGEIVASAATGYTTKVDAAGLSPGSLYHYRFSSGPWRSAVGRTRTLPAAGVASVKLAVFSCANHPAGFFHVYGEGARSDAEYAIHLGDYLYEDGVGGYATQAAEALGRVPDPPTEILALDDYRRRYAQYRRDPDLLNLHAAMPMIAVWDDHELANNAWPQGAENHGEDTEGSFAARRAAAQQAWHEWMPVRTGPDPSRIWRSFRFGDLIALHMLDTRMTGRDRQVSLSELLNPQSAASARERLTAPTRQMLGPEQEAWLQQQLDASAPAWQVLGQQVLMSRMELPVSVLQALVAASGRVPGAVAALEESITNYLLALATPARWRSAAQAAPLDASRNASMGYNPDAWDGYPAAREALLASMARRGQRLVVLSGDTHNAWHADLTLAGLIDPAQAELKVGEEFATTSVSSPGMEVDLPLPPARAKALFERAVDDLRWMDPSRRGYLKMTFTATEARADWCFVDTVVSRSWQAFAPETRSYSG